MSIICSVAVLAATNSDPYVAVSTVACFLEYQSVGVWLQKWSHAVSAAPAKASEGDLHQGWLWQ